MTYYGPIMNRAARVAKAARRGQVLLSRRAYEAYHAEQSVERFPACPKLVHPHRSSLMCIRVARFDAVHSTLIFPVAS